MEIVYYYDPKLNFCPVKKYLMKFLVNKNGKESEHKRNQKLFACINDKIEFVKENEGRPVPPISKALHEYSCLEILNPKDAKTVIRILYFRYRDKIVLLHAFEKPANYSTNKIKKDVDKEYRIGENYLNNFKMSPKNYEEY